MLITAELCPILKHVRYCNPSRTRRSRTEWSCKWAVKKGGQAPIRTTCGGLAHQAKQHDRAVKSMKRVCGERNRSTTAQQYLGT